MLTNADKKYLAETLDQKLKPISRKLNRVDKNVRNVEKNVSLVDKNVNRVDKNLTELSEYVIPALANIFKWTDDIHKALIGKSNRATNEN